MKKTILLAMALASVSASAQPVRPTIDAYICRLEYNAKEMEKTLKEFVENHTQDFGNGKVWTLDSHILVIKHVGPKVYVSLDGANRGTKVTHDVSEWYGTTPAGFTMFELRPDSAVVDQWGAGMLVENKTLKSPYQNYTRMILRVGMEEDGPWEQKYNCVGLIDEGDLDVPTGKPY